MTHAGTEIWAFDPGHNIGLAVVSPHGELLLARVLSPAELRDLPVPSSVTVVAGDGTGSAELLAELGRRGVRAELVDETGSTLQGRELYWQHNPPAGLLRLLPPGLRPVPDGLDAYAAWALALRWLSR